MSNLYLLTWKPCLLSENVEVGCGYSVLWQMHSGHAQRHSYYFTFPGLNHGTENKIQGSNHLQELWNWAQSWVIISYHTLVQEKNNFEVLSWKIHLSGCLTKIACLVVFIYTFETSLRMKDGTGIQKEGLYKSWRCLKGSWADAKKQGTFCWIILSIFTINLYVFSLIMRETSSVWIWFATFCPQKDS